PRWRPPAPASSPYITAPGAEALKRELKELWGKKRPEVVRALSAAAAEGDRSENAEYIYRKKQLGEIDRRIRYLGKRLEIIRIVDQAPADPSKIRFGAWVTLRSADGKQFSYRIVGADETRAREGWISIDSPVARSLLGAAIGDQVKVALPQATRELEVLEITYEIENPGQA
ncbi:MAG: transcription elongation factor GreB, partial [Gammaproteobacteria bacterium]|nr:transcription elongation factor GreB [Gammaproteobacteria bacterium]